MKAVDDYLYALKFERPISPARLKALVSQFVKAHAWLASMQSTIQRREQVCLVVAFHHFRVEGDWRVDISDVDRHAIQFFLTGKFSLTEMTRAEFEALRLWLHLSSRRWDGGDFEDSVSKELLWLIQERQREAGQLELSISSTDQDSVIGGKRAKAG